MRVLVVTNMFPTSLEPWFGSFVADQVDDLQALGFDMRVLHFDGRRDRLNYVRAARQVRSSVAREGVDLIHAHYGLTGALALTQRSIPVVTTLHGSDFTGAIPWQASVSWVVVRRCTPVFVSAEGARRLRCSGGLVIPVGVDAELFAPRDRAEARDALGWPADRRYVLLPGSRRALGKRPDLFDAAMREARRAAPDLESVSLEGFSRREAALVMNAIDVTLMTSDREGSPLAIKESLACMTPVVSVLVGDVPEVIAGLPGCAIVSREPTALANAVLASLESGRRPELRDRAQEFSRGRVAERISALYNAVARGNGP
jgi:teichuronic acid biosynthesis glycosyltransferase TuaC